MQLTRDLESIVATALLLLSGFLSPAGAQSDSLPPFPPPGRLIDIGGWKLHLNCTGEKTPGKPTVILEAGVGAFSVDWALVQPLVREICASLFLRPRRNRGWSDSGRTRGPCDKSYGSFIPCWKNPVKERRSCSLVIRSAALSSGCTRRPTQPTSPGWFSWTLNTMTM